MMSFSLLCSVVLLCGTIERATEAHNVAFGGRANQSSMFDPSNGKASNAIDGNRNSLGLLYPDASCTHTAEDFEPWWRVDLLEKYKVDSVVITNRGDCCSERLDGAELRIGNSLENDGNSNPVCAVLHIPAGESKVFKCNGMEGRWVNVVIPGRSEYLTLCEVEVYGEPKFELLCS